MSARVSSPSSSSRKACIRFFAEEGFPHVFFFLKDSAATTSASRSFTSEGNNDETMAPDRSAESRTRRCRRSTVQSYNKKTAEVKTKIMTAAIVKMMGSLLVLSAYMSSDG